MPNGKITAKQREILEFIKREILQRGYPPAVRDICEAVSLKSTSSVREFDTSPTKYPPQSHYWLYFFVKFAFSSSTLLHIVL